MYAVNSQLHICDVSIVGCAHLLCPRQSQREFATECIYVSACQKHFLVLFIELIVPLFSPVNVENSRIIIVKFLVCV